APAALAAILKAKISLAVGQLAATRYQDPRAKRVAVDRAVVSRLCVPRRRARRNAAGAAAALRRRVDKRRRDCRRDESRWFDRAILGPSRRSAAAASAGAAGGNAGGAGSVAVHADWARPSAQDD